MRDRPTFETPKTFASILIAIEKYLILGGKQKQNVYTVLHVNSRRSAQFCLVSKVSMNATYSDPRNSPSAIRKRTPSRFSTSGSIFVRLCCSVEIVGSALAHTSKSEDLRRWIKGDDLAPSFAATEYINRTCPLSTEVVEALIEANLIFKNKLPKIEANIIVFAGLDNHGLGSGLDAEATPAAVQSSERIPRMGWT
jgi:hypothetical protein